MQRFLLIDDTRRWGDVNLDDEFDLKKVYVDAPNIYDELVYSHPDLELVVARTFEEGMMRVQEGNWDRIYLDHDLGSYGPTTGYEIICFIEANLHLAPKWFHCCSANPVGRQKIVETWHSIERLLSVYNG